MKTATLEPRTAYEHFKGKRISDNHWRTVTKTLEENDLEINDDNVIFYAKLRKSIPKTNGNFSDILTAYQRAEKLLALNNSKIQGKEILELFIKEGINPHPATLSRWFKTIGGFRKSRFYYPEKLSNVLTCAFIYQLTNQSEN